MKTHFLSILSLTVSLLVSCSHQKENSESNDPSQDPENQALYDSVMKIHDEVMPKMEDIHAMKRKLKEEIANTPNMIEERKKQIDSIIIRLDYASKSMMDWMHEFSPPDSVTKEEYKKYLEGQLEKVKKVKEDILGVVR